MLFLIIDEAHTETDTHLANEVVDLIDPRIILKSPLRQKICQT